MLLLTAGLASLAVPGRLGWQDAPYGLSLSLAVRGLFALVLLFSAYLVYQQVLIRRLRRRLARQMELSVELEVRATEFHQLATIDALTGLYNRRVAEENLALEISRSGRYEYSLTVLALDLDSLKGINDQHGHAAGDLVLKAFAGRLRKAIRSSDLPARMGGDEFVVVLPECPPELVPRILARLTGLEVECNGKTIPILFSAGWAGYQAGERADQLLDRADRELYDNKRTGKVEEQVRQAKEQLQQAQQMEAVGRLVGGVAHDFNNLLMLIKGYSDLVLERLGKDDPLRGHVAEIQKASERATSLTGQILAFGRRQALETRILDLNAVLGNMGTVLGRFVGEQTELVTTTEPALGRVRADPGQMEQILLTLVANARDAMPQGGTLRIETANAELDDSFVRQHPGSRTGPHVVLAVSDTGAGMDAKAQARLFEPSADWRRKSLGSHFGLATVYGIVKQSGGYLAVQSQVGQGTAFRVYLPRVDEEASRRQERAASVDGGETILVVDDDGSLRKMAREFLEGRGYQVLTATDGADALRVADKHKGPIHLVVTDVVMPKMNGWELAKHLAHRRPQTKVLYVSGYADDTIVRQGLPEVEGSFLRKPFTLDILAYKLREALAENRKV
jgi:diguanylate cyclase (GGDEF)-like protein